jgi:hypothetical protein
MTRADFVNVIALDLEICARQIGLIGDVGGAIFRREILIEPADIPDYFRGLQAECDSRREAALAEIPELVDRMIAG